MKKFGRLSLILAAFVTILSGCTQSNIVSPTSGSGLVEGDGQPDVGVDKNIDIDWVEVREDIRDKFIDPHGKFADYVLDLDTRYDDASGLLTVLLPVTHKTTSEVAVAFGQDALKEVGTSIATQNFYYEAPDDEDTDSTYYGSYFDENDVCVQVFFYDEEGKTDTYLVNDTVKAGEQRALTAQN